MPLNAAQTFYIDPSVVANAGRVNVVAIDLYFKAKPHAVQNRSGITNPGVTIYMYPVINGLPYIFLQNRPMARVEYNDIRATADASEPTKFTFTVPADCQVDREHAFVINYDGDEDFILWTSKQGDLLVGTSQPSPGTSGQFVGNFFEGIGPNAAGYVANTVVSPGISISGEAVNPSTIPKYRTLTDTDLKFTVYVARYTINGSSNLAAGGYPAIFGTNSANSDGTTTIRMPADAFEYVLFDHKASSIGTVRTGERVFQNTVFWPGNTAAPATLSVSNTSAVVTTANSSVNFSTIFSLNGVNPEWIVLWSNNHAGAGQHAVAVRRVASVISNTSLLLTENVGFTNSAVTFHKSPVAFVDRVTLVQSFGSVKDALLLSGSNANQSVRFVNNTILSINASANGTGYNNTDVLTIGGFENVAVVVAGGYPGKANLVTNSTGGITALYLSNVGCGFVNTALASFTFSNSSGGASAGSGATLTITSGAVLKSELLGGDGTTGVFSNCVITNLQVHAFYPQLAIDNPSGTVWNATHTFRYFSYENAAAFSGRAYYAASSASDLGVYSVRNASIYDVDAAAYQPTMPSRSNEFIIMWSANGALCNATANSITQLPEDLGWSNSSVVELHMASNNDFTAVGAGGFSSDVWYAHYVYNNDYTNEHTNYGNAYAKHVTTKVNLTGNGAYAEDMRVYLTAYRPANTDLQVYARVHNGVVDPEAFDDKDWTRLEVKAGANVFSSPVDRSNMIELTYGFQASPNTTLTLAGVATTVLNQANVIGVGTSFSTNLASGDLVKLYQPLFPNNYVVGVVNAVTNTTHMNLVAPIANAGLVGAGLKVDRLGYPYQAFNNQLNDNVVRYHTTSMAVVDGYDTFQLKIILLSDDDSVYPMVDDVRATAVSA